MNRIVSLLPSSTEIICALGCGECLVGRSHECDYPPGVGDLPTCTAPKFDSDGLLYRVNRFVGFRASLFPQVRDRRGSR